MDHDCLRIGRDNLFVPQVLLQGMSEDQWHILGNGQVLKEIYRVRSGVAEGGRAALRSAAWCLYRRTRTVMAGHPEVRSLFPRAFLRETGDWETVMKRLPAARQDDRWKENLRRLLARRRYKPSRIEPYLESVDRYSRFLARQLFFHQR